MIPLALVALLLACGEPPGPAAPAQPGDLDTDPAPTVAPVSRAPSSSPAPAAAPASDLPIERRPRHRGRPVDIDLKDADLHNVFRLIADAGGVSIVVADDVEGSITLRLRQVPWDQALDTVVKLEKLHVERNGDVYLISRPRP